MGLDSTHSNQYICNDLIGIGIYLHTKGLLLFLIALTKWREMHMMLVMQQLIGSIGSPVKATVGSVTCPILLKVLVNCCFILVKETLLHQKMR